MIKIVRTYDYDLVRSILTHPDIYINISDDGSPALEDFNPAQSEACYYLLAIFDDKPVGVYFLHPKNSSTLEGHVNMLPGFRGNIAFEATRKSIEWIFSNTLFLKIDAVIPTIYMNVFKFTLKVGFTFEGISRKSYLKNSCLYDQLLLGITKEEAVWEQRQQ